MGGISSMASSMAAARADGLDSAPEHPSLRVAFIGNSFTYYNNLPHLVQALLIDSLGRLDDSTETGCQGVEVGACLRGGASFASLWQNGADMGKPLAAIGGKDMFPGVEALLTAPKGWDVVVLQDFSQGPARENMKRKSLQVLREHYIPLLQSIEERAGKLPVVMLYQTWGYCRPAMSGQLRSEDIGNYGEMSLKLAEGYAEYGGLLESLDFSTVTARVGEAWQAAHKAAPEIWEEFYQKDCMHPRATGTFISSVCIARAIAEHPRFAASFPAGLVESGAGDWPIARVPIHEVPPPDREALGAALAAAGLTTGSPLEGADAGPCNKRLKSETL